MEAPPDQASSGQPLRTMLTRSPRRLPAFCGHSMRQTSQPCSGIANRTLLETTSAISPNSRLQRSRTEKCTSRRFPINWWSTASLLATRTTTTRRMTREARPGHRGGGLHFRLLRLRLRLLRLRPLFRISARPQTRARAAMRSSSPCRTPRWRTTA